MGNLRKHTLWLVLLSLIVHTSSFQPNNRRPPNPPPNSRQPGPPGPPPNAIRRQGLPHDGGAPSQQPPINHRRIHGPPPPKHRGRPPFPFPRRRPPPPPRNRGPPPRDADRERRPPPQQQHHKFETPPKLSFHVPPAPVTTQPPPEEIEHRPQESYIQQLNSFQNPNQPQQPPSQQPPQQPQQTLPPHNIQLHIQQFGSQNPSQQPPPNNVFQNPNVPPPQFPSNPQPNQNPNQFGVNPSTPPQFNPQNQNQNQNQNQFNQPPNQQNANQHQNQFNQFAPPQQQQHQKQQPQQTPNQIPFQPPQQPQFNPNVPQFPQQQQQNQQEPQFQPPPQFPPPQNHQNFQQQQPSFQPPMQEFNQPPTFGQLNPSAQPPSPQSPPILEYAPPPNTFNPQQNQETDQKSKEQELNSIPKQTITFTVTPKPSKNGGTQLHFKISTPKPFKTTLKPIASSKGYFKGSTYRPPVDKLNTKFKYPNYPETEYRVHDGDHRDSIMSAEMEPPSRNPPDNIKDVLMNNRHDLNSPSRPHHDDVDEYSGPNYNAQSSAQSFSNPLPNDNILIAGVSTGKKVQERFDDYDNLQDGPRFEEDMVPKTYADRHLPYKEHSSFELRDHEYRPHHASQSIEEPFEFDRVKGKHGHHINPSIMSHSHEVSGSGEKHHVKFSQPDPLYHPEDDRSSSKEVDDFEPPSRYESFGSDFSGEKRSRGKDKHGHSMESSKKSTAEELLAALGLSTNPLVSMPNSDYPIDIPTKYSVSSWEKKYSGSSERGVDQENKRKPSNSQGGEPMGLLEYLNQKNEHENRATEPLYSLPDRQIGGSAENSFVVKGSMKTSAGKDTGKAPTQHSNNVIVGRPIPQFEGTEPRILAPAASHVHGIKHEPHHTGQESYIFDKLHNSHSNVESHTPVPLINSGLYGPSVPPPFTDPGTFTNAPPVITTPPQLIQHAPQKPQPPGQESYIYQKIHGEQLAFGPTPPSPHSVEEPNQGLYGAPLPHMQTGLYASGSEQIAAASAAAPSSGLVYSNGKINAPGGVLLPYGMGNGAQSRVSEPALPYNPNAGANQPVPAGVQTLYPQSPQTPQYAPPLPNPPVQQQQPQQQVAPQASNTIQSVVPHPNGIPQHIFQQAQTQHQLPASPPQPQQQQAQQPPLPPPNQQQQQLAHHQQQQQLQLQYQQQQAQLAQRYQQQNSALPSSPVLPPQQQQSQQPQQHHQLQHQASQLHPQVQQPPQNQQSQQNQHPYGNNPNEPIDRIAGIPNFSSEHLTHPQNIHQQQQQQQQQLAQPGAYIPQILQYPNNQNQNQNQNIFQAYVDAQNAAAQGHLQSVTPRYGDPYPVPVYVTEPDPIIEIIVQDSNMTLPPLPTNPPPPTYPPTPEPVHVFYVKYSQKNDSLDNYYAGSAPHVQLEQPISSISVRGPDRNGMLPIEDNTQVQQQPQLPIQDNLQSSSMLESSTQSPPSTTTLRTIIRPDRNEFAHPQHANNQQGGLVVSFDNPAVEEQIFANYTDPSQNYAQQIQQLQAQAQAHLQAHQQAQAQAHAVEQVNQQIQAQSQQQVQYAPESYYVNDQSTYPGFNKRIGLQELASLLESSPQDKQEAQENQEQNPPPLYQYVESNQNQNGKQQNLPEDVPEELRNQLVQSGILGNAEVQVINYSENLFKELGELPPEALAAYQAHSNSQDHSTPSDQLWSGSQMNLGTSSLSEVLPQSRSLRSIVVVKNSLRPKRGGRQRRVVLLITEKNDVLLYRPKDKSIRRIGDTSNPIIRRAINHTHHRMEKA